LRAVQNLLSFPRRWESNTAAACAVLADRPMDARFHGHDKEEISVSLPARGC
jgi:hypothetical protein